MNRIVDAAILMCILQIGQTPSVSTGEEIRDLTNDGAMCWFQDPRAVYIDDSHRRTYTGWVTSDARLVVGAYDHDRREIETATIKESWDRDDHNNNSFLVLPDNRLMIFYARHNKPGLYCRVATKPESISEWSDEVTVTDKRATYSHPVYLRDEQQHYVFWRHETWKPTFSTSKDGRSWTQPQMLLQEPGKEAGNVRPYMKLSSDGRSKIFFAFTDGHPRNEPLNSIHYLRYEAGAFTKADNRVVGTTSDLPLEITSSDLVYDARRTSERAWIWDIGGDERGYPVVVYTRLPAENDHRYHYARWDGMTWHDTELVKAGKWFPQTLDGATEKEPHYSGGITLNHADLSEVFLSRQINSQFEIEKWTTSDRGRSWRSEAITAHSTTRNVRPVVPRGYSEKDDHLLWMHGNYVHYTQFQTGIRCLIPSQSHSE